MCFCECPRALLGPSTPPAPPRLSQGVSVQSLWLSEVSRSDSPTPLGIVQVMK